MQAKYQPMYNTRMPEVKQRRVRYFRNKKSGVILSECEWIDKFYDLWSSQGLTIDEALSSHHFTRVILLKDDSGQYWQDF